jgi:hypothetical protein
MLQTAIISQTVGGTRAWLAALTVFALSANGTAATAQQPGAANQGRDCQTVRTCNFTRTGAVRGCLSSYSCRACRPVAVKCTLPGGRCQELRCDWGG